MVAGYSGTPLAKKLGIKAGHRLCVTGEQNDLLELIGDLPDGVTEVGLDSSPDVTVAFFVRFEDLEASFDGLAQAVFPDRVLWVAWPKKSSGVESDLDGNVVRELVLTTKLVDVKVCAISEVWSGLKVMSRKEHRN